MASQGMGALSWTDERLHAAADAAGVALWSWNIDTDEIALDDRAYRLWGIEEGHPVTFRKLSERIHPVDVQRVGRAFEAVRGQSGLYEIDFCILDNDQRRWISARGKAGEAGMVERVMFGIFMDITNRKQAEDAREMLAGEMSHRVKNLFAIASALTGIAARSTATKDEMAEDLTLRLNALGQAHNLVLPTSTEAPRKAARLDEVLAALLSPYDDRTTASEARVHLAVPELQVGATAVATLALVVHELATNSLKYGALGAATGVLNVTCADQDRAITLVWTEQGGPRSGPPAGRGFGSLLVARSMSGQLGGSILYDWPAEGMIATLTIDRARLAV